MADPVVGNPLSFGFWAEQPASSPLSYEALQTRRKIAEAMAGRQRSAFPKTFGEGLTYAGEKFADAFDLRNLDEQERRAAANEDRILSGMSGGGSHIPGGTAVPGLPAQQRRASETGGDASAPVQTAEAPYVAPGAVPGEVPLPPPRPEYARERFRAEAAANPALIPKMASMVNSENPGAALPQLETLANRMEARGTSLENELSTRDQNPNAYYPRFAHGPGDVDAFQRNVLTPVLRGSDVGGKQLGFSPTGNASDEPGNPFASRNLDAGRYNIAGHVPGNTEMYVQQENPAQLARLEASRVPGRNGITRAIVGPPPAAALPPGAEYTSLQPADMASTPGVTAAGIGGLNGPGAGLPPRINAAAAPPAAPYANPMTPAPDIAKAPDDAITKLAQGSTPSVEPIPPATEQVMKPPGPEPKRPDVIGLSENQRKYLSLMNNPRLSPAVRAQAKELFSVEEKFRSERQQETSNDYIQQRTQHAQDTREFDKWVREKVDRNIKQMGERLGLEKTQADIEKMYYEQGAPRQVAYDKSVADLNKTLLDIEKAKTDVRDVAGTIVQRSAADPSAKFEVAPGAPPMKDDTTELQGKARQFRARAAPEIERLVAGNNGLALTYFKDDVLASRLPFGMDRKAVSDAYRAQKDAMMNIGTAIMTHLSGASYGEKEMERTLSSFWPRYGDTDKDRAVKMERLQTLLDSIGGLTNDAQGRDQVARSNFNYEARRPVADVPAGKINDLSPGRKYKAPDGTVRQIPYEEIRTR